MLKPKRSKINGSTHIHQTRQKSLNKCLPENWQRNQLMLVEFMKHGIITMAQVHCKTPKYAKKDHKKKEWDVSI
jgi:hypothetical protein